MTARRRRVLLRGNVLVEDDELVAQPGIGQFIPRRAVRRGARRQGSPVAERRARGRPPTGARSTTRSRSARRTRPCSRALDRFAEPGLRRRPRLRPGPRHVRDARAGLARARDRRRAGRDRAAPRPRRRTSRRLETQVAPFADAQWPDADLVNAGYALPFCPPEHFDAVWQRVVAWVTPGGRFSGQLFGDRDEWVGDRDSRSTPATRPWRCSTASSSSASTRRTRTARRRSTSRSTGTCST